ncbi:MAG: hypothetical protein AB1847_23375 [bacterium]
MEFFKPVLISMLSGLLVCSILIVCFGAPREAVILGGFSVIALSMGKSIYNHFKSLPRQRNL